jgi:hypothetical protein
MIDETRSDRIQTELDRVSERLRQEMGTSGLYCQLYAAQQALSWAVNPESAGAPLEVIVGGKVQPPTGIQAGSGDCLAVLRPLASSDTCVPPR